MKILNLSRQGASYTANAYLVLGTWNTLSDVNTLVDVGRDPALIDRLMEVNTGVGKRRVDQVVLTHSHYDHASLLPVIQEMFSPKVYAYSPSVPGAEKLRGGEHLRLGDEEFEVLHVPAHSQDSICLLSRRGRVLFSGDTPLRFHTDPQGYDVSISAALEKISRARVKTIYPGHGEPISDQAAALVDEALRASRS